MNCQVTHRRHAKPQYPINPVGSNSNYESVVGSGGTHVIPACGNVGDELRRIKDSRSEPARCLSGQGACLQAWIWSLRPTWWKEGIDSPTVCRLPSTCMLWHVHCGIHVCTYTKQLLFLIFKVSLSYIASLRPSLDYMSVCLRKKEGREGGWEGRGGEARGSAGDGSKLVECLPSM